MTQKAPAVTAYVCGTENKPKGQRVTAEVRAAAVLGRWRVLRATSDRASGGEFESA